MSQHAAVVNTSLDARLLQQADSQMIAPQRSGYGKPNRHLVTILLISPIGIIADTSDKIIH